MSWRQAWCASAVLALAAAAACIDWGDPEMATASSGSSMHEDECDDRCMAKAQGCGATDEIAEMHCSDFCPADEMLLSCLEEATCAEVGLVFQHGAAVCDDGSEGPMCIEVGRAGCDPLAGIACCDMATCETSTGRCCLPANQPLLACTSNSQCCGNATCQVDPNDASKRWCR